jgi:hypothetical protein
MADLQVQEIKKLTQQIQMIQSEMGKHKESLEECLKVTYLPVDARIPTAYYHSLGVLVFLRSTS